MDRFGLISKAEKILESVRTEKNDIREYYLMKLKHKKIKTQINSLIAISQLFKITGKDDGRKITKDDILNLLDSEWYNSLKESSRKIYLQNMKMYIRFSISDEEEDTKFIKWLISKIKELKLESRELTQEDLISREDLELMLKHTSLKLQTLIMVLYEGGLRKGEVLGIRLKDIKFEGIKAKINIKITKKKSRNHKTKLISFLESVPYLKQWIDKNKFQPDEYLFKYQNESSLNATLNVLNNRLKELYPDKWNHKKLYPHLARHSRITELYSYGHFNDELMRKFAGWEPGSPMARVYSHLVDSDVDNALDKSWGISKPKKLLETKIKHPVICPYCNIENSVNNIFCWKCNNIIDKENVRDVGISLISQTSQPNKELENRINSLESNFRMLREAINRGILVETFPDGVESGTPNDEPIVDKYVKVESKGGKKFTEKVIDNVLDKK